MGHWLRFVIVWLVALALPVQGIAGATMAHCGPTHARMHTAQADAGPHAAAGHHHGLHDAAAPHHLGAAAADPVDHGAASHHAAAQTDKFTELGQYNCSACASCCSVCALLSTFAPLLAPEFAPTVFVAVVPRVATFATDGPDRPPRLGVA